MSSVAARASRGRRSPRRGRRRSGRRPRVGGTAPMPGSRPAPSGRPSSSPRTTPSTMPRRTPSVPRPTARSMRSRSASPTPAIPPRRPIWRQLIDSSTTWMPWRASHARSSKPSSSGRGSATRTVASMMAPRGGERPTGSTRRTRSLSRSRLNARATASTRIEYGEERAGATVTSSATPDSPTLDARTLRRSASMRSEPHPSPTSASATPTAARRAGPSSTALPTMAASDRTATTASGNAIQIASPRPTQTDPTSRAGQWSSTTRLTGSRGRAAARFASGRCPGRRRDRPLTRTARARRDSRRSSAR